MRCASWNVNGLRSIGRKGLGDWLIAARPDLLLVQETKVAAAAVPDALARIGDHRLQLFPARRPGYSGVGIYYLDEPDDWIEGLGEPSFDDEGRALFARYGDLLVGSLYFPNSQAQGARLEYRLAYGEALRAFLRGQRRKRRHIVLGGDFNVAHQPIDLARPKPNEKNPGYLPEERAWMTAFLADGYVDTWRQAHPDEVGYSWWSMRSGARQRGIGWRIDYLCVDQALLPRVGDSRILADVPGSDHCPVWLEIGPAPEPGPAPAKSSGAKAARRPRTG